MPTIQDVIKLYSDKLIALESTKFNEAVAALITNEFKYSKDLPQQFTVSVKRINPENWGISILSTGKPQSGSIKTPISASIVCKILVEAGGKPVENSPTNEYQFVFSLLPNSD